MKPMHSFLAFIPPKLGGHLSEPYFLLNGQARSSPAQWVCGRGPLRAGGVLRAVHKDACYSSVCAGVLGFRVAVSCRDLSCDTLDTGVRQFPLVQSSWACTVSDTKHAAAHCVPGAPPTRFPAQSGQKYSQYQHPGCQTASG